MRNCVWIWTSWSAIGSPKWSTDSHLVGVVDLPAMLLELVQPGVAVLDGVQKFTAARVAGGPGRPRRRSESILGDQAYGSRVVRRELRTLRFMPVVSRKGAPITMKQLRVLGSLSGTKQDLTEFHELMRGGQLNPPINRITPESIPEGLDRLRKGGVTGRLIAVRGLRRWARRERSPCPPTCRRRTI
ncbi:hypothetical protein [Streptomyces sp. NPDC056987]|uniref:hypothetical protein n=1 Tax=Streptomyces sp. NPDC056987 TaxID=3345988 RepID=UPI003645BB3E